MKLVGTLLLSSMCLGIIAMSGCNGPPPGTITFGDGVLFWTAPTKVARHEKLYKDQGLDVTIATFQTGLAAKNALLAGSLDVAMVATTPIASSVINGEEIRVIATYVVSDNLLKLVSIRTGDEIVLNDDRIRQDWSGDKSRVGYVPGTISQRMFDRLTKRVGIKPTPVKLQPGNIASALIDNNIDYGVIWEPMVFQLAAKLAEDHLAGTPQRKVATQSAGPDPLVALHLITRPDVLDGRLEDLVKFVRAIHEACNLLNSKPEVYRRIVKEDVGPAGGGDVPDDVWQSMSFSLQPPNSTSWATWIEEQINQELKWRNEVQGGSGGQHSARDVISTAVLTRLKADGVAIEP